MFKLIYGWNYICRIYVLVKNSVYCVRIELNNNSDNNDNRDGLSAESIAAGKGYSRMVSVLRGEDNHSR